MVLRHRDHKILLMINGNRYRASYKDMKKLDICHESTLACILSTFNSELSYTDKVHRCH